MTSDARLLQAILGFRFRSRAETIGGMARECDLLFGVGIVR
jgi:hypothetical protein